MSLRRDCCFAGRFRIENRVDYSDRNLKDYIRNVKHTSQDRILLVR